MKKIKINLIVLIICIILTITSITLFILKNYLVSTYDDNQNDLWKIFMNIENLNYENYIKNEYGSISEFRKKFPDKDPAIIYREFKDNVFNDITNKDLFSWFYRIDGSYAKLGDIFISANSILLISAVLIGGLNSYKIVKNLKLKHSK
ncbi:hypothetical protein [Mycoplasmopsis felis]|uniref:hypothetical protein n=1 Tax=Mycoplasmopsis felis TaxID=33923 RepID=UPI002B003A29|nr:hypothetical protein [Mycoplasmopsis felis]WQQ10449.1 hypothetical protein RRG49_01795 [Mycoplasmopsis felis]